VVTTVMSGRDVCCIYLVSWKSGTVTLVSRNLTQKTATRLQCNNPLYHFLPPQLREIELSNRWTPLWVPRLVDIDGNLIMLANCTKNSLEICKLELASTSSQEPPRMYTVCSLKLPALEPYAFVVVSTVDKEWVPTVTRAAAAAPGATNPRGNGSFPSALPKSARSAFSSSTKCGLRACAFSQVAG
jgi:hypothetical protein